MKGLKQLVHPGFISLVGHGVLLLTLLFVGASGVRSVPPEPVAVEIVPSDEVPQSETQNVNGTPLDSTSNGSEVSSDSKNGSASMASPRPKSTVPSLQQLQASENPQGGGTPKAAQQQAPPPADGETPPRPSEALVQPTEHIALPEPHPDAPSEPNAGELFALPLVLPGGRISGGLDAPANNPAMLPHDDTAAFRARLSSCSQLPAWFHMDDNVAILLRISFKRDGTLAAPPELLRSSLSSDAVALTNAAITALEKCQPFTELPADKYNTWKTLELVVTPLSLSRR
jgi:hypothetical protein